MPRPSSSSKAERAPAPSVIWASEIMHPKTAPRDGSYFYGIPKGEMQAVEMCWDDAMRCFFTIEFACVDRLSGWIIASKAER